MSTRRLRRSLRQFPFFRGIRQYLVDRGLRSFDRHATATYGQTGEDRILDALLPRKNDGFYVDVGAHHPTRYSNTFRLYKRGWHGIAVDANQELMTFFGRVRPRDCVVCAAVSDQAGPAVFQAFDETAVSTLSEAHAEIVRSPDSVITKRTVRTETLTSILDRSDAPARFDLLSVDVEGYDHETLRGLDLDRYRPQLIVVEMHGFALDDPEASPVYRLLRAQGYAFVGYVVMNGFFRDGRPGPAS